NAQDNRLQLVTFLEVTDSFFTSLCPGQIRQVYQAINATWQTNEHTKVSDRLDLAGYFVAFGVSRSEIIPWIWFALFHAQGQTTTVFVDFQNHHFNFVAQLSDFAWVDVLVSPVHFRHVYQTFNAWFDFNERTVVSQVGDF